MFLNHFKNFNLNSRKIRNSKTGSNLICLLLIANVCLSIFYIIIFICICIRSTFDEDRVPALWEDESIRQDIHSVASLLKLYFRELPNPLCTYQLYDSFVNAVQSVPEKTTEVRLQLMRETVQKLPPPHFR